MSEGHGNVRSFCDILHLTVFVEVFFVKACVFECREEVCDSIGHFW